MAKRVPIPFSAGSVLLVGLWLVAQITPVLAEVCDKVVGEGWTPDQGPAGFSLQAKLFWFAGLGVIAILAKRSWLSGVLCCLAMLGLVLLWFEDPGEPIWQAAMREGCVRPTTLADVILQSIAVATFAALTLFQERLGSAPTNKADANG
ncbi:MAG: hypothetical protein DI537_39290 [Stutzerimonas stutzeri]|uniref:Uncharacterized protein n=1 Tax=Bosea eneae TaxID=151454 RepID=A0ABW0IX66_9HYPH|nr:MAG: hypothetical protein DI537_39290 [Stutzerimonas stutzeri]